MHMKCMYKSEYLKCSTVWFKHAYLNKHKCVVVKPVFFIHTQGNIRKYTHIFLLLKYEILILFVNTFSRHR